MLRKTVLSMLAFSLSLFLCAVDQIDPTDLSAVVNVFGPQGEVSETQTLNQNYILLITGGTGSAQVYLPFVFSAMTDEENFNFYPPFGSDADLTAPFPILDPNSSGNPLVSCSMLACSLPFTFDVPQIVDVIASVFAFSDAISNPPPPGYAFPGVVSASLTLDGLFAYDPETLNAISGLDYSFLPAGSTSEPEPGTALMFVGAFLDGVAFRKQLRPQC